MKNLNILIFLQAALLMALTGCHGQTGLTPTTASDQQAETTKPVGGDCDGCDIMYVGMPTGIPSIDTSVGWNEKGRKLLVKGRILRIDGKTPAPGVIVYYYHTDNNGYYSPTNEMDTKARRHGHIRSWVKSDAEGKYAFYTIRPAPYPNRDIPAHIHLTVKEQDILKEYYIDEFVFDDDKLLTTEKRKVMENRGGNGILHVNETGPLQIAEHDIILGKNIPNYPK